jgi:hypothetical protein
MAGRRRAPATRKQGIGKTLHEAFENYAEAKGKQKLRQRRSLTLQDALDQYDQEWIDVEIAVQLHPHNQWIKAFRVSDPSR